MSKGPNTYNIQNFLQIDNHNLHHVYHGTRWGHQKSWHSPFILVGYEVIIPNTNPLGVQCDI
jgi:hypothetical protein